MGKMRSYSFDTVRVSELDGRQEAGDGGPPTFFSRSAGSLGAPTLTTADTCALDPATLHKNDIGDRGKAWLKKKPARNLRAFIEASAKRGDPLSMLLRDNWYRIDSVVRHGTGALDEDEFVHRLVLQLAGLYAKMHAQADGVAINSKPSHTTGSHPCKGLPSGDAIKYAGQYSRQPVSADATEQAGKQFRAAIKHRALNLRKRSNDTWRRRAKLDHLYAQEGSGPFTRVFVASDAGSGPDEPGGVIVANSDWRDGAASGFPYGDAARELIASEKRRCECWREALAGLPERQVEAFRQWAGLALQPYMVETEYDPMYCTTRTVGPDVAPAPDEYRRTTGLKGVVGRTDVEIAARFGVTDRAIRNWRSKVEAHLDSKWPEWRRDVPRMWPELFEAEQERRAAVQAEFEVDDSRPWVAWSVELLETVPSHSLTAIFHRTYPVVTAEADSAEDAVGIVQDRFSGYKTGRVKRALLPLRTRRYTVYPFEVRTREESRVVQLSGPTWVDCSPEQFSDMLETARRYAGVDGDVIPLLPALLLRERFNYEPPVLTASPAYRSTLRRSRRATLPERPKLQVWRVEDSGRVVAHEVDQGPIPVRPIAHEPNWWVQRPGSEWWPEKPPCEPRRQAEPTPDVDDDLASYVEAVREMFEEDEAEAIEAARDANPRLAASHLDTLRALLRDHDDAPADVDTYVEPLRTFVHAHKASMRLIRLEDFSPEGRRFAFRRYGEIRKMLWGSEHVSGRRATIWKRKAVSQIHDAELMLLTIRTGDNVTQEDTALVTELINERMAEHEDDTDTDTDTEAEPEKVPNFVGAYLGVLKDLRRQIKNTPEPENWPTEAQGQFREWRQKIEAVFRKVEDTFDD